ncbi:hypothetical protein [Chitinophaga sp.]|uniref:TlpA family protein disulfide reductase n=1 Tax=Chitinophaga sp. TaxID=1869181 RepID=UPI0031D23E39
MKNKILILIIIFHQLYQPSHAQKVNIGERCPDTKINGLMNYRSKEAKLLSAFNDKPLIIDFWFIRCAPCISTMIQLDSLQKKYNNQFNLLMVTSEKEEDIKKFFSHNEKLKKLQQPIVYTAHLTSDLKKLFPHSGEPHEVWIGKNGIVKAITSNLEITTENIKKFLKGDTLNLPEKMDILDSKYAMGGQPLLMNDEERSGGKRKLYYSWMGAADPHVPSLSATRSAGGSNGIRLIFQNLDFIGLYKEAYSLFRSKWQIDHNEMIKSFSQFKDSLRLQSNAQTRKNWFCYEIFLHDSSVSAIKKLMQRDLDNFFKLKSCIKQREVQYYVLSKLKNSSDNAFLTKGNIKDGFIENKGDSIVIKNTYLDYIAENRLYNELQYEVINEIGNPGPVDIVIPQTNDIQKIKHALNKYGLDINQETRTENVVILQDAEDL